MKKILFTMILLALPLCVNAMSISESFDVGDAVIVELSDTLKGSESEAFYVLAPSAAGEQYVTMIYDGVVSGSATTYDEVAQDGSHDTLTSTFTDATIYQKLLKATTGWTYPNETRLLTVEDLKKININPSSSSGKYEIDAAHAWLSARKITSTTGITSAITPEMYNYWTSSADTAAKTTSVFCVTYNESRTSTDGVWSTLESEALGDGVEDPAPKCAIRPVITIDKKYIECNNTKNPQTTTVVNVKTGVSDYYLPLTGVIIIASLIGLLVSKKTLFKKI